MKENEQAASFTEPIDWKYLQLDGTTLVHYVGHAHEVIIPDGVMTIGMEAFASNPTIERIFIPDSVREIKSYAFFGCRCLREVVIMPGIKKIGYKAFASTAIETIDLPDTITQLSQAAFMWCEHLVSVKLPRNIKKIPAFLFSRCYSLREVAIPETVNEIGKEAFYSCDGIEEVYLPDSVMLVRDQAFGGRYSKVSHASVPGHTELEKAHYSFGKVSVFSEDTVIMRRRPKRPKVSVEKLMQQDQSVDYWMERFKDATFSVSLAVVTAQAMLVSNYCMEIGLGSTGEAMHEAYKALYSAAFRSGIDNDVDTLLAGNQVYFEFVKTVNMRTLKGVALELSNQTFALWELEATSNLGEDLREATFAVDFALHTMDLI